MPKVLLDIQNKILSVAETHFKKDGFEKTDMREIAAEAEIAVGTIYLHYQNKETLYMQVITHSWQNTLEKIEEISHNKTEPEQRLLEVLHELVHTMSQRKSLNGLWMEIGSIHLQAVSGVPAGTHFSGLRNPISRIISSTLKECALKSSSPVDDQTLERLGSYAFIMTVDTCMQDHEKASEHVDLIFNLLTSYLRQSESHS